MALSEKDLQNLYPFKKNTWLLGTIFACILASSACSTPKTYNLNTMPVYSQELAIKNYRLLAEVQDKYYQLMYIKQKIQEDGIRITSSQRQEYINHLDTYLYWSSVAMVELFHGDYEASNQSVIKANSALNKIKEFLVKLVEHYSNT